MAKFVPLAQKVRPYFKFALASRTAARNRKTPSGTLTTKMTVVGNTPKSGCPEDSSKMHPTAAIAKMQEPAKNKPLFGVSTCFS